MCELRLDERMFIRDVSLLCKVSDLYPVSGIESGVSCGLVLGPRDAQLGEPGLESPVAPYRRGGLRRIIMGPGLHYRRLVQQDEEGCDIS